jgi:CheY-like chemotaxis protein
MAATTTACIGNTVRTLRTVPSRPAASGSPLERGAALPQIYEWLNNFGAAPSERLGYSKLVRCPRQEATLASILVVDDEPDVLEIVATIMASAGHSITTAAGGLAALNILDSEKAFDLLLTDIVMPGLNGFNLARMARMRRRSLKVLYMTGYHETVTAMRDTGERYGKLLSKPILPQELRTEVATALAGPQAPPAG